MAPLLTLVQVGVPVSPTPGGKADTAVNAGGAEPKVWLPDTETSTRVWGVAGGFELFVVVGGDVAVAGGVDVGDVDVGALGFGVAGTFGADAGAAVWGFGVAGAVGFGVACCWI